MIFGLFVFLLVVGIVLIVVGNVDWSTSYHNSGRNDYKEGKKKTFKNLILKFLYYYDTEVCATGLIVTVIAGVVSLFMLIFLVETYSGVDGTIAQMNETYKALCFKAESDFARDELGLLNKEIVDEIQSWNETIVYKQKIQDNFWVGIFYPDIYDDFETIDFSKLNETLNNTKTFTD